MGWGRPPDLRLTYLVNIPTTSSGGIFKVFCMVPDPALAFAISSMHSGQHTAGTQLLSSVPSPIPPPQGYVVLSNAFADLRSKIWSCLSLYAYSLPHCTQRRPPLRGSILLCHISCLRCCSSSAMVASFEMVAVDMMTGGVGLSSKRVTSTRSKKVRCSGLLCSPLAFLGPQFWLWLPRRRRLRLS